MKLGESKETHCTYIVFREEMDHLETRARLFNIRTIDTYIAVRNYDKNLTQAGW